MLKVLLFDDVVAARGEAYHLPGLAVAVHGHADDAPAQVAAAAPDLILMDFAMGPGHQTGAQAIRALRGAGFRGRIVAISSDPKANAEMVAAGADESLASKALVRSYLLHLGQRGDPA